jgi:Rrf2 family nitric oxide-sensitive transcriptional repressor
MQVLRYTDYALRALIYVAVHPDTPVSAATIAGAYRISVDHVAKATKALTRAGLLRATRGAAGGVELARPAAKIRLGAVVRLFEQGRGAVECLRDTAASCKIETSCRLRGVFVQAEAAFLAELDRHTLADIVENRPQLVRLLPR